MNTSTAAKKQSITKITFKYLQSLKGGMPLILLIQKEYPPSRKLFMLKCKICSHHILYSLDLQGIEALMACLLTEVGKTMDVSNKTKKPTNMHTEVLSKSTQDTRLSSVSAKKNRCGKKVVRYMFLIELDIKFKI